MLSLSSRRSSKSFILSSALRIRMKKLAIEQEETATSLAAANPVTFNSS